jgi:hypothetical protein
MAKTTTTEKRIRRGVFRSVPQMEKEFMEYVHQYNHAPKVFQRTAKADAILEKVERVKAVLDQIQTVRGSPPDGNGRFSAS